jgi:acyl-CoA thioesterase-1
MAGGLTASLVLPAATVGAAPVAKRTVLVFGDSLSAGYGMALDEAWPTLLGRALANRPAGSQWTVVNASISGETTHGGMTRLPATLARAQPAVVILELGGNDALRGLPIEDTRRNLEAMAVAIENQRAQLLVVGIALPPNYGDDYTQSFAQLFEDLARRHHAPVVPNLVEPLGTGRSDFQADGIHPQGRVQSRLLATVLPRLEPLLKAADLKSR